MKPTKLHIAVSTAVVRARNTFGWTQAETAKQLGITQHELALIETGQCLPSFPVAVRLCKLLHIDMASFDDCVMEEKPVKNDEKEVEISYRYLPMKILYARDLVQYTTYGILVEVDTGQEWRVITAIPDVSCDSRFVQRLAAKCNQGQLRPYQLLDVILDALP